MLALTGSDTASHPPTNALNTGFRKKRIACDNCHFSKVRCTGELSGCQRCERSHKTCRYSDSNMGRRPALGTTKYCRQNVHKAQDTLAVSAHPRQQRHHSWDSAIPFESADNNILEDELRHPRLSGPSQKLDGPGEFTKTSISTWNRANGPLLQKEHADQHDEHQQRQEQQQDRLKTTWLESLIQNAGSELDGLGFDSHITTLDDIGFPAMDSECFDVGGSAFEMPSPRLTIAGSCRSSPTSKHQSQSLQQHSQLQAPIPQLLGISELSPPLLSSMSPSSSSSQRNYEDNNCQHSHATETLEPTSDSVRQWAAQLEDLTRTLHKSPVPLDEALHHSSQLLLRVGEVLRPTFSADVSSSPASIMLILVCLTQAVALFEQCMPSVLAGSPSGVSDISLRLGAYQVDRKAQQALQLHVVGRELSNMLQVSKLIRDTLAGQEWLNSSARIHRLLLEDLQVRTGTLIYEMKQKRGNFI